MIEKDALEIIKMIGGWVLYPLAVAHVSIEIAKFHFRKDIKKQYLLAKDGVAREIINSLCGMLFNMWELANINRWIANGQMQDGSQEVTQRRQVALQNLHQFTMTSYQQLGQMGLYYGTEIVDLIAQLQSELNDMVNENNFSVFEEWDEYRRQRILPILERVHIELKNTVFDDIKSFRLHIN